MDPPPPAPPSATAAIQLNHPESSFESSPRSSRIVETWVDDPLPPVPNAKLRFMCSYGGHIMPRPHDKTLSYVGGDTRIVVVDRHSSLKDLCNRLSRTLLNGRPFTLKYQIPNEDLDNLISVATDEDLENMIEEHDRLIAASPPRPSRLRLFLFFFKPESTVSMGSLLDDAKSETWFVDALNNSMILSRGLSDSAAAADCLVNLDGVPASDSSNNLEAQSQSQSDNKQVKNLADVPDSPVVVENGSSYGSSSSSPSMASLPPIRVRVGDERAGIEEQFAHMTIGAMKQDDGYNGNMPLMTMNMTMLSAPMPTPIPQPVTMASPPTMVAAVDNMNRVVSDDDRSDQAGSAHSGFRKPPLPLQLVQQPRTSCALSLPSPDSVASDSSIASANSFSRTVYFQDQVQPAAHNIDPKAPILSHPKSDLSDPNPGFQREQVQDSSYTLPSQMDQNQQIQQLQQQQYVHASTHYIHHPTSTPQVPMTSYYPVYAQPSQQYPVYVMPVGHTQPYNMGTIPQSVAATPPPMYPTKTTTPTIPEVTQATTGYKGHVPSSAAFHQIPCGQFQQQQYNVGVPQMHHHQPQSIAVATANYGYDYGGSAQEQAYYTQQQQQQQNTPLPPQYQSMTPAAAAAALSDASKQFPADCIQQPNRTTQPV